MEPWFETVRSLRLGLSDLHMGGRSVVIAVDQHGRTVVYKPRPLSADRQMRVLVDQIAGFGLRHGLRTPRVIDRGEYGWQEFIGYSSVDSRAALSRFYWRQGSWLALMHVVRGVDLHFENLVARGEHPIPVDYETVFHHSAPLSVLDDSAAIDEGYRQLSRTVLRQALLPFGYLLDHGARIDNSGLGGEEGQVAADVARTWIGLGQDDMRVVKADYVTPRSESRPSLDGQDVDATDYAVSILQGFRETYSAILDHRSEMRKHLCAFATVRIRHIARNTRAYGLLLRESYYPNDLRDGLRRDELLDCLWGKRSRIVPMELVPHEQADLRVGDIPVFWTRPDSVDLHSTTGVLRTYFGRPSLSEAQDVLEDMSTTDCDTQTLLIRLSLSEAKARRDHPLPRVIDSEQSPSRDLLAASKRVAALLVERVIATRSGPCWITMNDSSVFEDHQRETQQLRNVGLAGPSVYDGALGIALYLAYLGKAVADAQMTEMAASTFLTARSRLEYTADQAIGPFAGRTGYHLVALHLASLCQDRSLLTGALTDLPVLADLVPGDRRLDIIGGSAGCIIVLLQLYRATEKEHALEIARACGDHLLATAARTDAGLAWQGEAISRPIGGFSHGAAGIAWALFELAAATGDQRYFDAARSGVAFERAFSTSEFGKEYGQRLGWCHGSASTAVGRALSLRFFDGDTVREEIMAGASSLCGRPQNQIHDYGLCHGLGGYAAMLENFAGLMGVDEWRSQGAAYMRWIRDGVGALESSPTLPIHGRFAGLMTGLAGVGWSLLHFARPADVPSILTLEEPRGG